MYVIIYIFYTVTYCCCNGSGTRMKIILRILYVYVYKVPKMIEKQETISC